MSKGSKYMIIGPTSLANVSFGIQPVGINNAVIKPQARIAPMLGMTMPARKPPNCCNFSLILILLSGFLLLPETQAFMDHRETFGKPPIFQVTVGTLPGNLGETDQLRN